MDPIEKDFLVKQVGEHHQYARQHINLVCTAFLTFAALNATFAKMSIDAMPAVSQQYAISPTITFGFFLGDIVAALVFVGAALQINETSKKVDLLIQKIGVAEFETFHQFQYSAAPLLLKVAYRTVLRKLNREPPFTQSPLNPIPVHESAGTFAIFAITCFVTGLIWLYQFTCVLRHCP